MIKGSIFVEKEEEEDDDDYSNYYWDNYNSNNISHISRQIENEITKAIDKKLFIGTKVKRAIGSDVVGTIRYFVRDKSRCYNKLTGRIEVMEVEWDNNFRSLYSPDQLVKVEE